MLSRLFSRLLLDIPGRHCNSDCPTRQKVAKLILSLDFSRGGRRDLPHGAAEMKLPAGSLHSPPQFAEFIWNDQADLVAE
jgi:hypothetical protein